LVIDADATDGADAVYAESLAVFAAEEDAAAAIFLIEIDLAVKDSNAAKDLKDAATDAMDSRILFRLKQAEELNEDLKERTLTDSSRKQNLCELKENASANVAAKLKYNPRDNNRGGFFICFLKYLLIF